MTKITSITKLYSIYLLYEYSKHFVQPVIKLVVQSAVRCKHSYSWIYNQLYSWLYNWLQSVNGL